MSGQKGRSGKGSGGPGLGQGRKPSGRKRYNVMCKPENIKKIREFIKELEQENPSKPKRSGRCLSCRWFKTCIFEPVEDYLCHSDNDLEGKQ